MLKIKSIIISVLLLSASCSTKKVCLNPLGQEVDWYAIFFMPASISEDGEIHYGYYDPNLSSLEYYQYDVNNFPPTHITRFTLSDQTDFNYFFWNDDKTVKDGSSSSASSTKAHAKGSLVYDSTSGAFLLHSLPRFPTRTSENIVLEELPSNAGSYGQTFLCISVSKETAETIAELINCVNVCVNKAVESDRVNSTPNKWVQKLISNSMDKSCEIEHTNIIKSLSGVEFTFYGKNYKNKIIPYDTTMREAYQDHFYVRTWSRPSLAPAQYDTYNLVNVMEVKYDSYEYQVTKEHSKWGITYKKNIVCFADLNHTESQKERGGHIVCFENEKLHNIMKEAIISTDGDILSTDVANSSDEIINSKDEYVPSQEEAILSSGQTISINETEQTETKHLTDEAKSSNEGKNPSYDSIDETKSTEEYENSSSDVIKQSKEDLTSSSYDASSNSNYINLKSVILMMYIFCIFV